MFYLKWYLFSPYAHCYCPCPNPKGLTESTKHNCYEQYVLVNFSFHINSNLDIFRENESLLLDLHHWGGLRNILFLANCYEESQSTVENAISRQMVICQLQKRKLNKSEEAS